MMFQFAGHSDKPQRVLSPWLTKEIIFVCTVFLSFTLWMTCERTLIFAQFTLWIAPQDLPFTLWNSWLWDECLYWVRQEIPFWWTIQCREHLISKKPMQIDVLVKNEKHVKLKKNIRRVFRQYNIIEYKSPEDGSGTGRQRHILPHRGCHPNTACHSPKAVKGA